MTATYTKLKSGDWGVRILGTKPTPGARLTVSKRDGGQKEEVVESVVWSGQDRDGRGEVHLCTLRDTRGQGAPTTRRRRSSGGAICAECGRGGALVRDLEDGILKHRGCCDLPP